MKNPLQSSGGFILIFTLLMLLGVTALAVGMMSSTRMNQTGTLNYKNRLQSFYASDGLMGLIAQEILDNRGNVYVPNTNNVLITGDYWNYNGALDLTAMRAHMANNPNPNRTVTSNFLGSNWNEDRYLVRWKGYIHPPFSGNYQFTVRADDVGAFYLSTDDRAANLPATPTCRIASWSYAWPKSGSAVSAQIYLSSSKRYYFEFLHAEGNGGDHGDVGWSGPEWLNERPILNTSLSPVGSQANNGDTLTLGARKVKYQVKRVGADMYALTTEAMRVLRSDSSYRLPLEQMVSLRGQAVVPPDTQWMRVIFYDFHADGSNPEFQTAPGPFGVYTGMVTPTIQSFDAQNAGYFGMTQLAKPMPGTNPRLNCGVNRWFRPWENQTNRDRRPAYAGGNLADCSEVIVGHDTTYRNRVIFDSLPFIRNPSEGTNAYRFSRTGQSGEPGFFWLDGKGFGNNLVSLDDGQMHNFAFCMEMHSTFQMSSGMEFRFTGDDDVWLYVNNALVMDLGYVHGPESGNVRFDDLNLQYGQTYNFDLFYCERLTSGSSIRIETNLPIARSRGKLNTAWKRSSGNL
jgi:fibro-slime domain-containing protein